jgi:hypothetical protein
MAGIAMRDRESLPDEIIEAIVARVRNENGVTLRALRLGKLSARAHAQLLSVLGRSNLEHTGMSIRVPLRDQVRAAVDRAGAAGMPTKALAREVKGARSAAELGLVVRELIADGKLVVVAQGREQRAAAPGPRWLREGELSALGEVAQALAGLAKATRPAKGKPRPTLDRSVLQEPLRVLQALAGRSDDVSVRAALRVALELAPAHAGLVRVPDVVRALEPDHERATVLDALDEMARAGTLELRPESAIARLPEEDRARCPVGPDGTPLSYARLVTGDRP